MSTATRHRTGDRRAASPTRRRRVIKHVVLGIAVFVVSAIGLMTGLGQLTHVLFERNCSVDSPHPFAPLAEFSCEMENLENAFLAMVLGFIPAIVFTVVAVRWIRRRDAARSAA